MTPQNSDKYELAKFYENCLKDESTTLQHLPDSYQTLSEMQPK